MVTHHREWHTVPCETIYVALAAAVNLRSVKAGLSARKLSPQMGRFSICLDRVKRAPTARAPAAWQSAGIPRRTESSLREKSL